MGCVTERGVPEEKWLAATERYLDDRNLSFRELSDPNQSTVARGDLVERLHQEFGHLGHPGLNGVIRPRAWWPGMRRDVEEATRTCPNCQVSQGLRKSLEREVSQPMVTAGLQPFERWGIDLIGRLPTTPNGNRWIITAIDYATGWPVAQAVKDATEEAIGLFLFERIFVHYDAPREIISDNGRNLLAGAVRYFVKLLQTRYRTTTPYHPRTNGKVENLNGILGRMLTKYLMNKPTRAWDLYLQQALFATRVHEYAVTRFSPFYLVYRVHPRIPSDPSDGSGTEALRTDAIRNLSDARTKANELLLTRAIRTKRVLIRNETGKKFESKWFGPYQVLQSHPLGTYALAEPNGHVLRTLINGSRLLEANVDDLTTLWTSSAARMALRRARIQVERPEEVRTILEIDKDLPNYLDLSTFTRKEWEDFKRLGARFNSVGEELATRRVIAKQRAKARRRRTLPAEAEQQKSDSDEWNSEANDYESEASISPAEDNEEDVSHTRVSQYRDADTSERELFDGPFAVVIPSRSTN
ncbi:hypothetical protein N7448_005744 [Penicillium atrosanguineum]|nr:hypothetical protein N7448_005744 [Penicillium atrosanguineum]